MIQGIIASEVVKRVLENEQLRGVAETTFKEGICCFKECIPHFSRNLKFKITSFKEADKPLNSINTEIEKSLDYNSYEKIYESLNEALSNVSIEEKQIYEGANLQKGIIKGRECLQRTDINYSEKNALGISNLELMESGNAPIKNGKPVELHHIGQNMDSPLAELTREEHREGKNYSILHNSVKESDIDRSVFNNERINYWKARAEEIKLERGEV